MAHSKFAELIKNEKPTLVDFSAEWCGPCKIMKPIFDRNPGIALAYQIQSVPTLMLFRNSNILWRQSGVVPTEQLKQIITLHSN
jgi:thioredoxin 1